MIEYFNSKHINPKKFDKDRYVKSHISYMLSRTNAMFHYNNLPDTIPEKMLELYLQTYGSCVITKVNEELYAFVGGLGGEPDAYYRPTLYTVSNPALNFSKNIEIGKEGVFCLNDTLIQGLMPIFEVYGNMLAENMVSMRSALINSRMTSLISAMNETSKASADLYVQRLIDGDLSIVLDKGLEESINVNPLRNSNDNTLTSLIEHQQYLRASEWNTIGINANYNMKRESITSSESDLNNESLFPLVDEMLDCRLKFVKEVNELFGTNIEVDLSSVWKHKKQVSELEVISAVKDLADGVNTSSTSEIIETTENIDNMDTSNEIVEQPSQLEEVDENPINENIEEVVEILTEDVLEDLKKGGEENVENENSDGCNDIV